MRSINTVYLLGNLTRDVEVKFTGSGKSVAKLGIATSRRVKKGEEWTDETEFHNVVLWDAEKLASCLTKGKPVHITGRLQTRKYETDNGTRYSTEVVCENLILLGGGEKHEGPVSAPRSARQQRPSADDMPAWAADDEAF